MALLEVVDLRVRFHTHSGVVRAVDGVSLSLEAGETLAIVGESGSGKSVTNLALLGLVPSPPGEVETDALLFEGRDLRRLSARELRAIRGDAISMIFQDPMTSLNPLMSVGRQLGEVLEVHRGLARREAQKLALAGLADVGIPDPEKRLDAFPHELSGGIRQRVMIAMALLCHPKLLIADEPTTALDVTIQAQILELMKDLQRRHGTAILLVTHSMGVVARMADRVHVMYAGRIVEAARTEELFEMPLHPYTQGLLRSVPALDGDLSRELDSIPGQPPDLARLPSGCAFRPRCDFAFDRCARTEPPLEMPHGLRPPSSRRSACFVSPQIASGLASKSRIGQDESA